MSEGKHSSDAEAQVIKPNVDVEGLAPPTADVVRKAPRGIDPTAEVPAGRGLLGDQWFPLAVFLAVAAVLFLVAGLSAAYLPLAPEAQPWHPFPDNPWLAAWARWDAGWYWGIAERGYFYNPGQQSSVAFFPAYPLLERAGGFVLGNTLTAGIVITALSGLGTAMVFFRWCRDRLDQQSARTAVLLLLLFPFSLYLVGVAYSDALFLFAVTSAFLLLERDRPLLAGLAGAVATATRPVGVAVVAGLWLLALKRRGVLGRGGKPLAERLKSLRPRDAGLLLAPLGLLFYVAYLWWQFGNPLAFIEVLRAPGWDQPPSPNTWFKLFFFRTLAENPPLGITSLRLIVQAGATLAALALVPAVYRRFGLAYATYSLLVVALPAISSKDFVGMGRYVLAAFPCFAVLGKTLAQRPILRIPFLALSATGLILLTSYFARYYYIA